MMLLQALATSHPPNDGDGWLLIIVLLVGIAIRAYGWRKGE